MPAQLSSLLSGALCAFALGAFGARLRDAVDPETVLSELATATGSTLQPAHLSVWLKTA